MGNMGDMVSWMAGFALLWVILGILLIILLAVVIVKLLQS